MYAFTLKNKNKKKKIMPHYVPLAALELFHLTVICLLLPPECWDQRRRSPHPADQFSAKLPSVFVCLIYMCECFAAYVHVLYVLHTCCSHGSQKRVSDPLGLESQGVTDPCEPICGCRKQSLVHCKNKCSLFLIRQSSPKPSIFFLVYVLKDFKFQKKLLKMFFLH